MVNSAGSLLTPDKIKPGFQRKTALHTAKEPVLLMGVELKNNAGLEFPEMTLHAFQQPVAQTPSTDDTQGHYKLQYITASQQSKTVDGKLGITFSQDVNIDNDYTLDGFDKNYTVDLRGKGWEFHGVGDDGENGKVAAFYNPQLYRSVRVKLTQDGQSFSSPVKVNINGRPYIIDDSVPLNQKRFFRSYLSTQDYKNEFYYAQSSDNIISDISKKFLAHYESRLPQLAGKSYNEKIMMLNLVLSKHMIGVSQSNDKTLKITPGKSFLVINDALQELTEAPWEKQWKQGAVNKLIQEEGLDEKTAQKIAAFKLAYHKTGQFNLEHLNEYLPYVKDREFDSYNHYPKRIAEDKKILALAKRITVKFTDTNVDDVTWSQKKGLQQPENVRDAELHTKIAVAAQLIKSTRNRDDLLEDLLKGGKTGDPLLVYVSINQNEKNADGKYNELGGQATDKNIIFLRNNTLWKDLKLQKYSSYNSTSHEIAHRLDGLDSLTGGMDGYLPGIKDNQKLKLEYDTFREALRTKYESEKSTNKSGRKNVISGIENYAFTSDQPDQDFLADTLASYQNGLLKEGAPELSAFYDRYFKRNQKPSKQ